MIATADSAQYTSAVPATAWAIHDALANKPSRAMTPLCVQGAMRHRPTPVNKPARPASATNKSDTWAHRSPNHATAAYEASASAPRPSTNDNTAYTVKSVGRGTVLVAA